MFLAVHFFCRNSGDILNLAQQVILNQIEQANLNATGH